MVAEDLFVLLRIIILAHEVTVSKFSEDPHGCA